ncbi:hypothetical protein KS527_004437, partial [Salmonella enterica]|nr:hypothetical protein [Salmonella enterica]
EITPEMVGQKIAVYTSIETKRTKGGRTSSDQVDWIQKVTEAGGIAFVANNAQSALSQLTDWLTRRGAKKVDHKRPSN